MDSVHLQSADAVAGRVVPGDVVEVTFIGSPENTDITATIAGVPSEVTEDQPGGWTARATLPGSGAMGVPVTFAIRFTTPDGVSADPVVAATDGSVLFWSTDEGLVDDAFRTATVVGSDGQASSALAANAAQLFDGNQATHSDTRAIDGVYAMTWDFGQGSAVSLTGAELLVRQDGYGISRISNMRLEGSDDLVTWTRLTPALPRGTLDWQVWPVSDSGSYRYVRLVNGNIIGVAELRAHGTRTVDLAAVLAKADATDLSPYSRASAISFTREVEAVRLASGEPGADTEALAVRLLGAWDLLEPAPVEVAHVEPGWVAASTPSWDGTKDAVANGWAMFDGAPSTFTDTTQASGWVQVLPEDGGGFAVDQVRLLPRVGYATRSSGVKFQGSDDGGQTWETFATSGDVTAVAWTTIDLAVPVHYGALRVLAAAGNTNVAEVQFVRSVVDTTGIDLYLAETGSLVSQGWTADTWAALAAARTAAIGLLEPGVERHQAQVDAAAQALASAAAGLEPAELTGPAIEAPGQGTLWSDSGWTNGLSDGRFTVTMSLWWGSNATRVELYENGQLIASRDVADDTPEAQHVAVPVTGRANGVYEYVAVLLNSHGRTTTTPLVVQVTDASPGVGVLSHDNWDGDGDYAVAFDLWWGTAATTYRLYEDDVLVDTQALVAATPAAQHAVTALTGRSAGQHVYRAELENSAGLTHTAQLVVDVR